MNVCGIVVEYNPMHNGHIYHIQKAKQETSCTHLIAVMSGNFVQRGEPSIVNKWTKTSMALSNGVDLVIELPLINSISSAEGFCYSSVKILDSLNIVDSICFGSEEGSLDSLIKIAKVLNEEPKEYLEYLSKWLKTGASYPRSRQHALSDYLKTISSKEDELDIISLSNNILSIEYLKALSSLNSTIKPYTIQRINNDYNDVSLTGSISSATSIRQNITDIGSIKKSIPENNYSLLNNDFNLGLSPVSLDNFSDIILYKLRESSLEYISSLVDVSEGLEYKIKKSAENTSNIYALIDDISSKRYPKTRIQRILLYALFGITKEIYSVYSQIKYIRVLGFNNKGREILNTIKKTSPLPLISMPNSIDIPALKYDILASDIYTLAYSNPDYKLSKSDLKTPPIYLK